MKLDYSYIKQILQIMEEYDSYQISSDILMQKMQVITSDDKIDDNRLDKFIGHIKLLADNGFIDSDDNDLGFSYGCDYVPVVNIVMYRITSRGYEFIDMLKNDTVFQKIKNFAISNAWDIGKEILISIVSQKLNI